MYVWCWSVPSAVLTERVRSISIMRSPTIVLMASIFSVHSAGTRSERISSQTTTTPLGSNFTGGGGEDKLGARISLSRSTIRLLPMPFLAQSM